MKHLLFIGKKGLCKIIDYLKVVMTKSNDILEPMINQDHIKSVQN